MTKIIHSRKNSLTESELDVILTSGKSVAEISNILKRSPVHIRRLHKKYNIIPPKFTDPVFFWSDKEDDLLKISYLNSSDEELMSLFPTRTIGGIKYRALDVLKLFKNKETTRRKNSEQKTKYSFDINFFKKIDTHEKAYWMGFIWADGSISKNVLSISLHINDKGHIEKFKHRIKAEHPIKDVRGQNMSRISVINYQLPEQLRAIGICQNKTNIFMTPVLDDKFLFSFLLGLFDGDGSIFMGKSKHSPPAFTICVHPEMGEWLMNNVGPYLESPHIYPVKNKRVKIFTVSKQSDVLFLYNHLYKTSIDLLDRKKIKFFNILQRKGIKPDPSIALP